MAYLVAGPLPESKVKGLNPNACKKFFRRKKIILSGNSNLWSTIAVF
jgi:hypothetical protein